MNAKTAEVLLPCYRPGKKLDPRIIKAVRFAEGDPTLAQMLSDQMDFDEQMVDAIHFIKPPDDLRQKLAELSAETMAERKPVHRHLLNPAVLAIAFGVLVIIGFLVWNEIERRADFPGRGAVEKLLDITSSMNGTELEPTTLPAGQLGDAVFMKGFEGFALPAEFASVPAVGWRVFKHQGHSVAQLAIDQHSAIVLVFRSSDFGVQPGEEWRVLDKGQWIGAVNARAGLCTLVTFRGDNAEMQQFIQSLHP